MKASFWGLLRTNLLELNFSRTNIFQNLTLGLSFRFLLFSLHFNPLIGVHHLIVLFRNEPKTFLVTIPEAPAGLSSSICRSRARHSLRCGTLLCTYVSSHDEGLFSTLGWKQIKERGTTKFQSLEPWRRETYYLTNKPTRPRPPLLTQSKSSFRGKVYFITDVIFFCLEGLIT